MPDLREINGLHGRARDARLVHASLPFSRSSRFRAARALLAGFAVMLLPAAGRAQAPRPWLDWRSVSTDHFTFHFPEQYRTWTLALAERMEGIRAQVGAVVGFVPERRVTIVVDDPSNDANGTAFTALDAPSIVLWPTPPEPREEIGNFRMWGELVATHEFAHVAHLTRASRNRWQNLIWALSPVPLGPIAVNAPRWAIEGFATYVEGRVTGSGRPNHAWRAAILRQFALEGRLPSYAVVSSANSTWESGSFAYLAGSAFLEWLARREGDSSVTALWRRMTAKTVRSFDAAFVGVYGGAPAQLYGRFVAELTADALAFERALDRDARVSGTLVQRLTRSTGDPAVSPDGRFVALAIRRTDAPSEVVVWKTEDEPDSLARNRQEEQLRRDPDDVPDRSFYPPPKRVVISLLALDGASYEQPRWMPDNKHLLLTRRMLRSDGTVVPDVFLWSAEDGGVSRVTNGAGLRDVDPSGDGRWAAGVRCENGWCDLVRLDLNTGATAVLVAGSLTRNYYRPRVSRRTGEIVAAEQAGDRWRIVRVDPTSGAVRYADPDDGVTRYDATFEPDGRTIVATSEANGVPNLERLPPDSGAPVRLTSVTGAAVAGDVAPNGSLWFLSLHAGGYDLRRLTPDSATIARAANMPTAARLAALDSLSPVLPPRAHAAPDSTRRPARSAVGEERSYGVGPDVLRYTPGAATGYGGSSILLGLVRTDPVGRLGAVLTGAAGAAALPEGASLQLLSRSTRTELVLSGWASHEAPSRQYAGAYEQGLDLARFGGALRLRRRHSSDGGEMLTTLAALSERQIPSALTPATRSAGILAVSIRQRQRDTDARYQEELESLFETGRTDGGVYVRHRHTLSFAAGGHSQPMTTARISYGSVGGGDGSLREQFAIGGFASPLIDPVLDARRVDAPAYPVGSTWGASFSGWRVGVPFRGFELYYAAISPDQFKTALRSFGVEMREHVPSVAALGTPAVTVLAGFGRAIDEPVKKEWRYYVSVAIAP